MQVALAISRHIRIVAVPMRFFPLSEGGLWTVNYNSTV